MNKIIVICGPTCSGKTKFAIRVASLVNGEIISADSMQVYSYMDIGTAKPTVEERAFVPHHMIDIVSPDEYFNVYKYSKLVKEIIKKIIKRNKIPVVVGGSGLYIASLVNGLSNYSFGSMRYRKKFYKKVKKYGIDSLYNDFIAIDNSLVSKIHKNDVFRIMRRLEIFKSNYDYIRLAKKFSFRPLRLSCLILGLKWERSKLYKRINNRVDMMIYQGFIEEVENLLNIGFLPNLRSMQALGYRHIVDFLINDSFWNRTLADLKRDHRRYAKRQFTWFNSVKNINWVDLEDIKKSFNLIRKFFVF